MVLANKNVSPISKTEWCMSGELVAKAVAELDCIFSETREWIVAIVCNISLLVCEGKWN